MYTLENNRIRFRLDDAGKVVSLANAETGREYAGGCSLWRIIRQNGAQLEEGVCADTCAIAISQPGPDRLMLHYTRPRAASGEAHFEVDVEIRLAADELEFDAELRHTGDDPGEVLREFQFPLLGNLQCRPETGLIWGANGGQHHPDLLRKIASCHSNYMAKDNKAVECSTLYPGLSSVNCYLITEPEQSLYIASCDPAFSYTLHLLRKRKEAVDATLVKYPFLNPGERCRITGYRVAPVSGSWHRAADHYRCWCDTWMKIPEKPESVRTLTGWHRLIMRHQYGETLFHYRELPRILASGLAAGIDTLFLFGWHEAGHDAGYPEYRCDPAQGGSEELKRQVAAFQRGGGKVILYFNGQLIDTATEFYLSEGRKLSTKLPGGQEHREFYRFGGDGTALRQFGNKVFATACPACEQWHARLKQLADFAIELGCAGVFFDQMGYVSTPCCDPSHGHRVPFMEVMRAKAELLGELREYIKSRRPEMSFGIEWNNDLTSQHVDYIHSITGGTEIANPGWRERGERPQWLGFSEFVRYLFPEQITTDRDIRDDQEIEWRVNHAVRLGLRSDVEIYRCRALIDATPRYKAYLKEVNDFRRRNRDLLFDGLFRDTDGVWCDSREPDYALFRAGSRAGVLLTQSHRDRITATVKVPGGRYTGFDALGAAEVREEAGSVTVEIPRDGMVLLRYDC